MEHEIEEIDVEMLKERLDRQEGLVLIDCREEDEWNEGHIERALFKPLSQIDTWSGELDKNKSYVMQCRSGRRSLNAAAIMKEKGIAKVQNLSGGIQAWLMEGFEVTTD